MKALSLLLLTSNAIRLNEPEVADPEWVPAMTHVEEHENSEGKTRAMLEAEEEQKKRETTASFMLEQGKLHSAYYDRKEAMDEIE